MTTFPTPDLVERAADLVVHGIAVRTDLNTAMTDIPAHWQQFQQRGATPPAFDAAIYAVYCDYEADWRRGYTLVIGVAAAADAPVPEGLRRVTIPGGRYARIAANGEPPQVIPQTWNYLNTVWAKPRRYVADFERYTARDAAEIFVGVP